MGMNLIVYAVPVFLLLIAVEYIVTRQRHKKFYEVKDFTNNISTGVLEQIISTPLQGILILGYHSLYQHFALFAINPNSVLSWLALWIGVDFCYYWFHRATHRNVFLWIGHSVHHQSEYYNLSVALRQGVFQTFCSPVVYFPLALIGFPTWMFVTVATLNTLYQFWIHTQTIGHLGWFEKFFNTPSHHRVHHGKNSLYIDKNYAGSLIIWDKMFGTFEPESVAADYGVTEPLETWNPFYANIKVAVDTLYYGKFLKKLSQQFALFFQAPEAIIKTLGERRFNQVKRQARRNNCEVPALYLLMNVLTTVLVFSYFLLSMNSSWLLILEQGLFIAMSLFLMGRVCNGARGIFELIGLELGRTLLLMALLMPILQSLSWAILLGFFFWLGNYVLFNNIFCRSNCKYLSSK